MRTGTLSLLAATIFVGAMSAASAGESPRAAMTYDWSGFYVGGTLGYGWGSDTSGQFDQFVDPVGDFGTANYFRAGGNVLPGAVPHGVIGGLQIGYDWQLSSFWVLGVAADFDGSDIRDSKSATFTGGPLSSTTVQTNSAKIDWFGTLRGRVGYALNNLLLYGTGGLAYGRVESNVQLDCTVCIGQPSSFAGSNSVFRSGWTVGAGFEYRLTPNWSVGAEYLYFDLGTISTTVAWRSGERYDATTFSADSKFAGHIVRAVLNYRFSPSTDRF